MINFHNPDLICLLPFCLLNSLNVGAVSALELPVGFFDEDENFIVGPQAREVEESCGVSLKISDLVNLSQSAYENNSIYNASGLCPSLGNSR